MTRLGVRRAYVDGTLVDGDVEVDGGAVVRVGVLPAGRTGTALPGYVDLQVNGFAGVDFAAAGPADVAAAAAALAATGVTSYQPTLISSVEAEYLEALPRLAGPGVVGVHLEGPFLAPGRHGAHDPARLAAPDPALLDRLLGAGRVTQVTLAPEPAGALDLVETLVARGVSVALGHSDADAATAHAAFDRGATAVTHLFNAMAPLHHRAPGLAGAALARDDVVVTLIADVIHVAADVVRLVFAAAAGRVALISDAIAAARMPDGEYPLGKRTVRVADGVARLSDGTLAGSVLTMDQAVRNVVDLGVPFDQALAAATAAPARLLGRPELGTLRPGTVADLVVVDDDLAVVRTFRGGADLSR